MTKKAEQDKTVKQVRNMFGIPDSVSLEDTSQAIGERMQQMTARPCMVSFAFNPATGQLLQLALSPVPVDAKVYNALGKVTTQVAQNFYAIATEVAANGNSDTDRGVPENPKPLSGNRGQNNGNGAAPQKYVGEDGTVCRGTGEKNGQDVDNPREAG